MITPRLVAKVNLKVFSLMEVCIKIIFSYSRNSSAALRISAYDTFEGSTGLGLPSEAFVVAFYNNEL